MCKKVTHIQLKPVLNGHCKEEHKLFFKTDYRLMKVKSIAECSDGSILQYFGPSLSYHLSRRPLFLSNFEWSLKTGFTVLGKSVYQPSHFMLSFQQQCCCQKCCCQKFVDM